MIFFFLMGDKTLQTFANIRESKVVIKICNLKSNIKSNNQIFVIKWYLQKNVVGNHVSTFLHLTERKPVFSSDI